MKKVAILCSGGDAPGMNAGLRSVVRTLIGNKVSVTGVRRGYQGLGDMDFISLDLRSVANLIHRGGTFLKTSRCPDFKTKEYRKLVYENLKKEGISGLVVLGGDGSFRGLKTFSSEYPDIVCGGLPCTIDNDVPYSSMTVGFDTAVNTAVSAIDKVRDTANAHERTFVIEVMGRRSSELAENVALAAGAESVIDLRDPKSLEAAMDSVRESVLKGKHTSLIVVLESESVSDPASFVSKEISKKIDVECRPLVLGHLQRGGSPTASDRNLASIMGYKLVNALIKGDSGVVIRNPSGLVEYKKWDDLKTYEDKGEINQSILSILAN